MSNLIHWKFENTFTVFKSPKENFETAVCKLRTDLNLHSEHPIQIIPQNNDQPNNTNNFDSNSFSYTTNNSTVSKRTKKAKSVEETVQLQPLFTVLDESDPLTTSLS